MGLIRLFLAVGVLAAHFNSQVLSDVGIRAHPIWMLNLWSGRAVVFFYIVSGFLMSYVLHEKDLPTRAGTLAFYRARFLRIYPLWWAVLLIASALAVYRDVPTQDFPLSLLPSALLFGTDWLAAYGCYTHPFVLSFPPETGIGWTLGAELTFYLMAPFVLRRNAVALAALGLSAMVRVAVLSAHIADNNHYIALSYFFFPATLMFFMLGHFGAVVYRRWRWSTRFSIGLLVAAAALSCLGASASVDTWGSLLAAICFALSLPGLFAATKDNRFFNGCGDLTYPLYLTHSLTIAAVFWPLGLSPGFGSGLAAAVITYFPTKDAAAAALTVMIVAVATLVAWLTHVAIEAPARRLVDWSIFSLRAPTRTPLLREYRRP